MARLDGKIALITGATGGIGAATADAYLREGASVMLVGRSEAKLEALRDQLDEPAHTAVCATDAADESGVEQSVAATVEAFGGLDILFANAGTEGVAKPLIEMTVQEVDDILRTNVIGVWLAIKHATPAMTARGGGAMIATSSIAGQVGCTGLGAYVASKHGVNGLVRTAAIELARANIRVNAIAPGLIDNRMARSLLEQLSPDNPQELIDTFIPMIPQRRFGTNEEIAALAVFLASDESSYCTGSIHTIDGGYTAI